MDFIKRCNKCYLSLSQHTPLYTCCTTQAYCKRCRPNDCFSCRKNNWSQLKEKKCFVCRRRLNQDEGLKEDICGQHYCPRCLAHHFLPQYLSRDVPIIVEMRCGHYIDKINIEAALADYCINCGFRNRPDQDFQLQNGMNLCSYCFKCEGKNFDEFFHRCLSCSNILRSRQGSLCHQMLICKQCSQNQTMIEQSIVRSNLLETRQASAISELKSEKFVVFEDRGAEEPSEELSIVSRFSAFDILQGEDKRVKPLSSLRMLSKNSVEIRVQNLKITPIMPEKQQKILRCELCSIYLQQNCTLPNTTYSHTRICKMCYAQTFDKSYLSFSRSNNYVQNNQKSNSLPKKHSIPNSMKSSMLPPQNSNIQPNPPIKAVYPSIITRVQRKQAWQIQQIPEKNLCEICKVKQMVITRLDKKKVCVQCRNKQG